MNAYLVRIPETRAEYVSAAALEPPEPWMPTGVFIAATAAQAKRDALNVWAHSSRSGVYTDDWSALRVRLLAKDVALLDDVRRGELPETRETQALSNFLWGRAHEILDHGGAACDCPGLEWDDATGDWKAVA